MIWNCPHCQAEVTLRVEQGNGILVWIMSRHAWKNRDFLCVGSNRCLREITLLEQLALEDEDLRNAPRIDFDQPPVQVEEEEELELACLKETA